VIVEAMVAGQYGGFAIGAGLNGWINCGTSGNLAIIHLQHLCGGNIGGRANVITGFGS
jgi:hypothetical protein